MISRSQIIEQLGLLKPFLQKEFSVKSIGLFGSFADETQTEEIDIELLVEFERPMGWKFLTLELYLEEKIGKKLILFPKMQ